MKKTTYTVELIWVVKDKLIPVIDAYRKLTGLGLKEAMDKVNSAPCVILETVGLEEAERCKTALEEFGSIVSISGSTEEAASEKPGLKKVGADFIIFNLLVVSACAAIIAVIEHEEPFFLHFLFFVVWCSIFWFPLNFSTAFYARKDGFCNNPITDHIVNKTIKKKASKHGFDNMMIIPAENAKLVFASPDSGKLAYVSNLNPWKFQVFFVKDIDDIKHDYKKSTSPDKTRKVYFQFSYQGKVMKFPIFVSKYDFDVKDLQKEISKAAGYATVLKGLRNRQRLYKYERT